MNHAAASPSTHTAGFTLVELLVVCLILALAATAIPYAIRDTLPARRLRAAAETLAADVRATCLQAELTGQPMALEWQPSGYRLAAAVRRGTTEVAMPTATELKAESLDGRAMPALTCYPDGSTTGATVTLRGGVRQWQLRVSRAFGHVTLQRSRQEAA